MTAPSIRDVLRIGWLPLLALMTAAVVAAVGGAAAPGRVSASQAITNGKIVFQSARPPGDITGWEIYTINPDGTGTSDPLTPAWNQGDPAFSPDGTKIAYVTSAQPTDYYAIFIMDADGGHKTHVVGSDATGTTQNGGPAWSPDMTRLAFHSAILDDAVSTRFNQIEIVNVDGTGLRQISSGRFDNFYPSWSPDGSRIVFQSNRSGNWDLWTIRPDGTDLQQLTTAPGIDIEAEWSPDGSRIVYTSNRDNAGFEIYTMSPDGSNITRLTNNDDPEEQAAWSPDGTKIVYWTDRQEADFGGQRDRELYTMNADGTAQTRLTDFPNLDERPSWGRVPLSAPIDTAPPTVTIALSGPNGSTPDGANGWFVSGPVTGTVSADDTTTGGSAISSIDCGAVGLTTSGVGTPAASGTFSISTEGVTHLSCTATDAASNASAPTFADVSLDITAPVVTLDAGSNSCSGPTTAGACHGTQTAGFTATDATSGVASPCTEDPGTGCSFTQSSSQAGLAVTIASGPACDVAGNCATGINAGPFEIDATVDHLVWTPTPIAPTGSLAGGATVRAVVTAYDAAGTALPNATFQVKFVPGVSGAGASATSFDCTGIGTLFTACRTDSHGQVNVTYRTVTEVGGAAGLSDTLTAALDTAGSGAVSTAYTYVSPPTFTASPSDGTGGVHVLVQSVAPCPGHTNVVLALLQGTSVVGHFDPGQLPVATDGSWGRSIILRDGTMPGDYTIIAECSGGIPIVLDYVPIPFTVDPSPLHFAISPTTGPVGGQLAVHSIDPCPGFTNVALRSGNEGILDVPYTSDENTGLSSIAVLPDGTWSGWVDINRFTTLVPASDPYPIEASCFNTTLGSAPSVWYEPTLLTVTDPPTSRRFVLDPSTGAVDTLLTLRSIEPCPVTSKGSLQVALTTSSGAFVQRLVHETGTVDDPDSNLAWVFKGRIPLDVAPGQYLVTPSCTPGTVGVAYDPLPLTVTAPVLRFTLTPGSGHAGDLATVASVDPCPGGATVRFFVKPAGSTTFRGVAGSFAVRPDGSWGGPYLLPLINSGSYQLFAACDGLGMYLPVPMTIAPLAFTVHPASGHYNDTIHVASVDPCPAPETTVVFELDNQDGTLADRPMPNTMAVHPDGSWSGAVRLAAYLAPGPYWLEAGCSTDTLLNTQGVVYTRLPFTITSDNSPPSITLSVLGPNGGTPNGANGWFVTGPVLGGITVTAPVSSGNTIASIDCGTVVPTSTSGIGSRTAIASFAISTEGTTRVSCVARDSAGRASPRVAVAIRLDTHGPSLAPTIGPATIVLHGNGHVTPHASDATSGLDSQSCGPIVTDTAGPHSVTCTATDKAGNSTTVSAPYLVEYRLVAITPRPGATVHLNQLQTIALVVADTNGNPIPDAEAQGLATRCAVRVSVTGVQSMQACLTYSTASHLFTFSWPVGPFNGRATMTFTVAYLVAPTTTTLSVPINIQR